MKVQYFKRSLQKAYIQFRNGMKWSSKVDDRTKQKIELLYRQFDKFIDENHSASTPEDAAVLKQWVNFKQIIEKNPTDFETMHQYVNKIGDDDPRQQRLLKENASSPSSASISNSQGIIDINKTKLKKVSLQLLGIVNKNNKELFRS